MMLSETIVVSDLDVDTFYASMQPEVSSLDAKRFSYTMKKKGEEIIFSIKANDEVAMKAATSSIQKLTTVFKKMNGFKNGKRSISGKNTRTSNT